HFINYRPNPGSGGEVKSACGGASRISFTLFVATSLQALAVFRRLDAPHWLGCYGERDVTESPCIRRSITCSP
ncbi:MAG: hypothetical protein ABSG76_25825, partial [Xanthobacteraceae bacterium]